jgi:hypothetical protein
MSCRSVDLAHLALMKLITTFPREPYDIPAFDLRRPPHPRPAKTTTTDCSLAERRPNSVSEHAKVVSSASGAKKPCQPTPREAPYDFCSSHSNGTSDSNCLRMASSVAASAGWNASIRSSCSVTSCGAPSVVHLGGGRRHHRGALGRMQETKEVRQCTLCLFGEHLRRHRTSHGPSFLTWATTIASRQTLTAHELCRARAKVWSVNAQTRTALGWRSARPIQPGDWR